MQLGELPVDIEFESKGVARVNSEHVYVKDGDLPTFEVKYGDITGLPDPEDGVVYIVSLLVLQATDRTDVVAPASGHPGVVRKDGQIWSVPGFVRRSL